jgi:hypothetical protein
MVVQGPRDPHYLDGDSDGARNYYHKGEDEGWRG